MKNAKICLEDKLTEEEKALLIKTPESGVKSLTIHDYFTELGLNPNHSDVFKTLLSDNNYGAVIIDQRINPELVRIVRFKTETTKSKSLELYAESCNRGLPPLREVQYFFASISDIVKMIFVGGYSNRAGEIENNHFKELAKKRDEFLEHISSTMKPLYADSCLYQYLCIMNPSDKKSCSMVHK